MERRETWKPKEKGLRSFKPTFCLPSLSDQCGFHQKMLTSSIQLLGSYLQPSPNLGHCLFSCFWSCDCLNSRVLARSPQESGVECWAAATPWGRWFYRCGGILTSGGKSSARQHSSAWFLRSWPKGFLSLTKEDLYGPAMNSWENKSFSGIWERGQEK